ncbi:MAG: ThuA domain-containing protein [Opitutales bacterium]
MKILTLFIFVMTLTTQLFATAIVYEGTSGPGVGKHIVFLASDHEYRSEESCPALARILAKHHGFKCTVVFGTDDNGHIKAGSSMIEGIEALRDADLFFVAARFLNPPAEQMAEIDAYLRRGGPVVGLRTSSHGFKIPANSEFAKYDFRSKVEGFENGFGHQILGNTWVGHYGTNHKQACLQEIVPEQKDHVILSGVGDNIYNYVGGYMAHPDDDWTVLTNVQPLASMERDSGPDLKKPAVPSTWTRHYKDEEGDKHRVFHSTAGTSEDFQEEDYRRLVINGVFWAIGMEDAIKPDLEISFVGPYHPSAFSFDGAVPGVKPSDLEGWDSPIMPKAKAAKPQ